MALALNKILVTNTSTNTASAYFQTVSITSVGIGNATAMNAGVSSAQYVPAGTYVYPPTANVTIEVNNYNASTNTNAWTTLVAANVGAPVIISDGWNIRANATTATQTVTLFTVNGGQSVTGQYNS
jgi:hypothetical protein